MNNKNSNDTNKLAGRLYDITDYQKQDQLSKGLATTHEQVSDAYMKGEIKPEIDDTNSKNTENSSKG